MVTEPNMNRLPAFRKTQTCQAPPLPSTTYHISLHDAAVDARADGILVRIETLVIGCPRHPILLHHAGRVRVMLDHNSVLPPSHLLGHISVDAFGVCGGGCSRARGGCDGDEGDESGPPAAHAGQNRPTQPPGTPATSQRRRRLHRKFLFVARERSTLDFSKKINPRGDGDQGGRSGGEGGCNGVVGGAGPIE